MNLAWIKISSLNKKYEIANEKEKETAILFSKIMFFQTNTTRGDNEYMTDKIMLIMLWNDVEY